MGIFYVLTVIALLVTFILFKKSEKKQNLINHLIIHQREPSWKDSQLGDSLCSRVLHRNISYRTVSELRTSLGSPHHCSGGYHGRYHHTDLCRG